MISRLPALCLYNRIAMRELFFLGIITKALYPRSNNTGLRDDLKTIRGVTLRQHAVGMHGRCTRACVRAVPKCKHGHVLRGNTCRAVPVKINHVPLGDEGASKRRERERERNSERRTAAGRNSRKRSKFETLVSWSCSVSCHPRRE